MKGTIVLTAGVALFTGKYTLVRPIQTDADYELWEARDVFEGPLLIKAWPFGTERPADEERALWNAELRHLFRLASLPEGEEHLVVLRDAGVDKANRCFAMALNAPGLVPLSVPLASRTKYDWLKDLKNQTVRAELWRGIRRLALGLIQLHQQQMFHRAISARTVFVDPGRGPSTLRLGGFEWTVRLGDGQPLGVPPTLAPEETYSFESDWLLLGLLIARLMAATGEHQASDKLTGIVLQQQHLTGDETDLLERMITDDRSARLSQGYEILQSINRIIAALDEPRKLTPEDYLALVALLGPQRPVTLAIIETDDRISALDIEAQRQFIEQDLQRPRLVRRHGTDRETYSLVGNRLSYQVTEYMRDEASARGAWDLAYSGYPAEVRSSVGEDDQVILERPPIRVFTLRALSKDENVVRRASISWKPYLPQVDSEGAKQDSLQQLHDFFRVTNQIELLMTDAEIFAYVISDRRIEEGAEIVMLHEAHRRRPVPDFAKIADGLAEFLNREIEKRDGDLVHLGDEDALDLGREVPLTEFWTVVDADPDTGTVELRRPQRSGSGPPPSGYLRTFGLFGQMSLIKRRRRAIDRLERHAYLLRALQTPSYTFLDTGERSLPRPVALGKLDDAKQSAMRSIWRTRPIFALQGPPGTGKTTLVANLLAQIFVDDPVAQVLVTAQAHAAVDVLREKVADEVAGLAEPPLAVRLRRTKGDDTSDPEYVEQVSKRMLETAIEQIGEARSRSLQRRWLEVAAEVVRALTRGDTNGHAKDFCELVKRAAGITYCTTTAGNLEELADSTQTFDWSIVEEAGKAHGFDLALPLQTGHRWLLIGDQKQLTPYRYEDFHKALSNLDATVDALLELPKRAGGLVDMDLLLRWTKYDKDERGSRRKLWLQWLPFFETLHAICERVKLASEPDEAGQRDDVVLAKMLSQQHRMHPTIAGLVSHAYYEDMIESKTYGEDDNPLPRVVHPFTYPPEVAGRAILWLDVPWVARDAQHTLGVEDAAGRLTSEDEIDAVMALLSELRGQQSERMTLAILSPYRRQVRKINDRLKHTALPDWVQSARADHMRESKGVAATVDSFQGNQADVVVVSLVRNNARPPGAGLGFLRDARRMNVLFSRAERLLVLVGSWDFFQYQLAEVPADATQPLGHWRLAMDYLATCIRHGGAERISTSEIGGLR